MTKGDLRPDIALFGTYPEKGGVPRRLANVVKEWVALGYSVDLVSFRDGKCIYPDEIRDLVRFVDLGTRRKSTTLLALWRYVWRNRPRVILSTAHLANTILARLGRFPLPGTRRFLSVPNTFGASQRRGARSHAYKLRSVRRLYRHADGVIAISEGVRRDLTEVIGLCDVPVHRIFNGSVTPDNKRRAREPVNHPWLTPGRVEPTVITVGRLAKQKDHQTLLRAITEVNERATPCRLIIVGEGDLRTHLHEFARSLGIEERVDFPGWVDNPYSWIARADCFVLSSLWEGFPNVLAEAVGLGVPCVSTDCPSGPSDILAGGRYGRLVPVADAPRLAEAIKATLDGPRPTYDVEAATAGFTSAAAARNYLEVFGLAES